MLDKNILKMSYPVFQTFMKVGSGQKKSQIHNSGIDVYVYHYMSIVIMLLRKYCPIHQISRISLYSYNGYVYYSSNLITVYPIKKHFSLFGLLFIFIFYLFILDSLTILFSLISLGSMSTLLLSCLSYINFIFW